MTRAILDAARELFVAEGYQNVSIRKIADRIEYSPAAIYSYFGSKDDIFLALAEEGFRLLVARSGSAEGPDPLVSIRRAFWTLYEFSKEQPEYFALMFVDRSVPRISRDWERFAFVHDIKARIRDRIQAAIDAGLFPAGSDPHAIFGILSASVIGPAVMQLCSRLAPGESADDLARDTLEAALAGLRAGVPLTFKAPLCEPGSTPH